MFIKTHRAIAGLVIIVLSCIVGIGLYPVGREHWLVWAGCLLGVAVTYSGNVREWVRRFARRQYKPNKHDIITHAAGQGYRIERREIR